ncbi:MAG TPA: MBL fold metallo-hydrolase [Pseudonocardiaceae bacterium]|jgi:L-ascorbate metabolism protein UlaG (beta-lactamase superfamily)|nr:MBL fold metallo-hydrolase [Pseudonocardiaceae bacterium]
MARVLSRRWPRSFADRLTAPLPGPAQFLRLLWEGGFTDSAEGADRVPVAPRVPLPAAAAWLAWLGHASFLIRLGGCTVAVDPVLSERILGAGQRLTPPGLDRLPPLDLLLISHNHYDHLDAPTLRGLPRATRVIAPGGLGRWFRRRGFTDVTELDWWEAVDLDGALQVTFVPAHHWSRRGLLDRCASLWGGWILTAAGGLRLYHAGDSGYGPRFAEIGSRYPGIDVAMLPVGAYAPRWFMHPVHTDPAEAVQAAQDVGARVMVPMHWGTFQLSREPVLEPIERTRAAWAAVGRDPANLWDLAIGESRPIPAA